MPKLNYVLEMSNIRKEFPGVVALKDVSLQITPGEVHALCGENGAGKSTLMKILSGSQTATSGEIFIDGVSVKLESTRDAEEKGISMIYQEFNLINDLSVGENIYLGKLPRKGLRVDWNQLHEDSQAILKKLNLDIDSRANVSTLSVAEAQMIEIAKSLTTGSKIIIMDEPTAALSEEETKTLFKIIEVLQEQNIAIIYISHRMDEIFQISNRLSVLRNGQYIATKNVSDTNYDDVVSLMIGRNVESLYPVRDYQRKEKVFEVKNLSADVVSNINMSLHKGEILGVIGLLGSGNFELAKMFYGARPIIEGEVLLEGQKVNLSNPYYAVSAGIGLVPEDRKQDGLVLNRSVKENITLASLGEISNKMLLSATAEEVIVDKQVKDLNIKVYNPNQQIVENLSGGNQQKVLFGKVLETNPKVCILCEPTRGVDVGAKAEIYSIIDRLTHEGKSIILVSSDMEEVMGLCDRVMVMRDGQIVMEKIKRFTNQEEILAYASGGVSNGE